jgi:hypothetical protein
MAKNLFTLHVADWATGERLCEDGVREYVRRLLEIADAGLSSEPLDKKTRLPGVPLAKHEAGFLQHARSEVDAYFAPLNSRSIHSPQG